MDRDDFGYYDVGGAPVVFSTGHKRPVNPLRRPRVRYRKMILSVIGLAALFTAVFFGSCLLKGAGVRERLIISLAASAVYALVLSKRAVIWLVHLYQSRASDATRLRCVFTPSCSEYMILAVEKYGSIIGVVKGIHRLMRCHAPNGGEDYP